MRVFIEPKSAVIRIECNEADLKALACGTHGIMETSACVGFIAFNDNDARLVCEMISDLHDRARSCLGMQSRTKSP
jgi:hypothetical protein